MEILLSSLAYAFIFLFVDMDMGLAGLMGGLQSLSSNTSADGWEERQAVS